MKILNKLLEGILKDLEETLKRSMIDTTNSIERIIMTTIEKIKRKIFLSFLELFFYLISIVMIIAGITILISRFLPLDISFLIMGVLTLYLAILFGRKRFLTPRLKRRGSPLYVVQRCRRQKIKVFENAVFSNLEIIFFWVGNVLERRALFFVSFFFF